MGQVYIKVTWDQFTDIEEMIELIKPLCEGESNVELNRNKIWIKGSKDELIITVEIPNLVD